MKSTTGDANRTIEWTPVTEWQSKQIAKGLVEAVVEVCRDAEFAGKHHVHVRVTPTGQPSKDFYVSVASREAGEAMVADKLAAAK